jgi:hypothetical protein
MAQNIVKNELKKSAGLDLDVAIKSFTLGDLLNGKFESVTLSGKNVVISGFHFSSLKIQTLCPYASIDLNSRPIKTRENLVLGVWAEVSEADLINTINYGSYLNVANSANLSRLGITSYSIYPSSINVENSKLYFMIHAIPVAPYSPLDISIGADFRVQNGNMVASRIDMINLYSGFDLSQFSDFLAAVNNWRFPFSLTKNDKSEIQIQNVHIVGDKIFMDALVFIPKM